MSASLSGPWREARRLFHACIDLDAKDRADLLAREHAVDPGIKAEVESLLAHADENDGFMERAAAEAGIVSVLRGSPVGQRVGAYEIVELLAEGGMGGVYKAVRADDQYRQQVAIKLVRRGLEGEAMLARFKAERQILASLAHPHIARMLDGGLTEDGLPYFVMELIEGEAIDLYCERRRLSVAQRLELFCDVCEAVQYAHQNLTVHRDLKPGNILVTESGVVKLLDFGIAKVLDAGGPANATITVLRAMTPEYSSPEQLKGEPVTTATDVYSLGVILYRLLSGCSPYRAAASEPYALAREVCDTEPAKPSVALAERTNVALRKQLEGDLDGIVLMALRKERDKRYASAQQLSDDIRRHLARLPVLARQSTWRYRSGRFLDRNKLVVSAVAFVVMALVAGIVSTAWQARIAAGERDRAQRHFNSVRELANAFMFEFHDAIKNLSGALPARQLVVAKALTYLDGLAAEAGDDLSLQRELATAYEKVGDLQAGYGAAHLGDTEGALRSYRKALSLRESSAQAAAGDPGGPGAQESLRRLITTQGKLGDLLVAIGDAPGAQVQAEHLLATASKLAAMHPGDATNRRILATAYLDHGWKQAAQGQWQEGLAQCRKGAALMETLLAHAPTNKPLQRILALTYGRIAELVESNTHNHAEAAALHEKALSLVTALQAEDLDNADLKNIAAWEKLGLSWTLSQQGHTTQALAMLRPVVSDLQAFAAANPQDSHARFSVGYALNMIGYVLLQLRNPDEALSYLRRVAASAEPVNAVGGDGLQIRAVTAYSEFLMGQAHTQQGRSAPASASLRRAHWQEAKDHYQRSLALLQDERVRHALRNDVPPDEPGVQIATCDSEIASLSSASTAP
jgi:eukaryotic-like serine/threonine-protein kinase